MLKLCIYYEFEEFINFIKPIKISWNELYDGI